MPSWYYATYMYYTCISHNYHEGYALAILYATVDPGCGICIAEEMSKDVERVKEEAADQYEVHMEKLKQLHSFVTQISDAVEDVKKAVEWRLDWICDQLGTTG